MQNHINFTTITLKGNFHALPRVEVFLTAGLAGGEANLSLLEETTKSVPYIGYNKLKGTDNSQISLNSPGCKVPTGTSKGHFIWNRCLYEAGVPLTGQFQSDQ